MHITVDPTMGYSPNHFSSRFTDKDVTQIHKSSIKNTFIDLVFAILNETTFLEAKGKLKIHIEKCFQAKNREDTLLNTSPIVNIHGIVK